MRSELLQAERNAFLLFVEVENDDIDLLVELDDLLGIIYAAPAKICDVDESVDTTQVDKYAVAGDILNGTFKNLAFLQFRDNLLLLSLKLCLDESLMRNNDVTELLVDLNNFELHGLSNELIVVAYGMNVNLRTWQEGLDAEYIDNHTALCAALDEALDNLLLLESCIDAVPSL